MVGYPKPQEKCVNDVVYLLHHRKKHIVSVCLISSDTKLQSHGNLFQNRVVTFSTLSSFQYL